MRQADDVGVEVPHRKITAVSGAPRDRQWRSRADEDVSIPVTWRSDIEALAFQPDGRQGYCMIHRRAFRTLLGFSPTPEDCQSFFRDNLDAFGAAANAKIVEKNIAEGLNFHLTSRDVARRLTRC